MLLLPVPFKAGCLVGLRLGRMASEIRPKKTVRLRQYIKSQSDMMGPIPRAVESKTDPRTLWLVDPASAVCRQLLSPDTPQPNTYIVASDWSRSCVPHLPELTRHARGQVFLTPSRFQWWLGTGHTAPFPRQRPLQPATEHTPSLKPNEPSTDL